MGSTMYENNSDTNANKAVFKQSKIFLVPIKNHYFSSIQDDYALHVTRDNFTNVLLSLFDQEICVFDNIQSNEYIILSKAFVHSNCSVYFGKSDYSLHNYSLIVENQLFTNYSNYTLTLTDSNELKAYIYYSDAGGVPNNL